MNKHAGMYSPKITDVAVIIPMTSSTSIVLPRERLMRTRAAMKTLYVASSSPRRNSPTMRPIAST